MKKLTVLDLFSGIGGFSLGLEKTGGFETVAFCEMKPHAQAVLAKNFPGVPCHSDVTTYDFKQGEADVLTAGFPCQDISFAGIGAGLAGARSGLYREVVRALRVVRPRYAVLENVAALLSRGLGTVLGDVAEVGYDAEWHCIPASAVGAPHRRDRIWIIANSRSEQHEGHSAPFSGALSEELSSAFAENTSFPDGYDPEANSQRSNANDSGPYREEIDLFGSSKPKDEQERKFGSLGEVLADPNGEWELQSEGAKQDERGWFSNSRKEMAYAKSIDAQGLVPSQSDQEERSGQIVRQIGSCGNGGGWWAIEPGMGRVANGVPNRVDRLEELGNAVVPQVPEVIGRAILAREAPP